MAAALDGHGLSGAFGKLGRRGVRHVYEAHVAELPCLAGSADLMLGGVSAAGAHKLGLQGGYELEAYVAMNWRRTSRLVSVPALRARTG